METDKSRTVKSTKTTFAIVKYLADHGSSRITDIAAETGASKSTVHHHLSSLLEDEWVVRTDSEYELGLKFYDYGVRTKLRSKLYQRERDIVKQLAEQTDEVVWLVVEEHGWAVSLHKAVGENAIQTLGRLGKLTHLHYHAAGKAILAHLSEDRRREIYELRGLPSRTDKTITDPEILEEHLAQVRSQGYAVHDEEAVKGARAVGAPIIVDDVVIGSISVAGPAHRIVDDRFHEKLPKSVIGAANEIELKYSYDP